MDRITQTILEFSKCIADAPKVGKPHKLDIDAFKPGPTWPEELGGQHGIYAFTQNSSIIYIGRALKVTLDARIYSQINYGRGEYSNNNWGQIIGDPITIAYAWVLTDWKPWWIVAVEVFLIETFWDEVRRFNRRRA